MQTRDYDLVQFDAVGAPSLPEPTQSGKVDSDGASIWYASFGEGDDVVVLLHGGLGHSGNWGYQVPFLVADGYRVVTIDSRGHGRSTRDSRPYTYAQMVADLIAVLEKLTIREAHFVGWSDGAVVALLFARQFPERVRGVFFFACNVDSSGIYPEMKITTAVEHCISRHDKDYRALSPTPDDFKVFSEAVGTMQASQPNLTAHDLSKISVPVTVVRSEHDEFLRPEHPAYLAATIPSATLVDLLGVSHFAPLQDPALFNRAIAAFVHR